AITNRGSVNTTDVQNRRVMSTSSGSGPSCNAGTRGSNAMPQMGQLPGASRMISGCIGHVYSTVPAGSAAGSAGFTYCAGFARNFSLQRAEQNRISLPSCTVRCGDVGFTVIPQTGSFALPGSRLL